MSKRPTKYDGDVPVFPGMGEFEFYENEADEGAAGIVIVSDDGIVGELVNPSDKPTRKKWFAKNESLWRFSFGAYGDTHLLVWSKGVEDGLELAADWLEKNAPGHLMTDDSDEMKSLLDEAREELGEDADDEEVQEQATVDLTYTEAGYLTSHEWTVDEVGDKKLLEAAHYASDLADYRFHYNKSGIDVVDVSRDDVYLLVNPNTQGSSFWSVEGRRNSDKIGIIVLGSSESHAERQATPVLDNMLGGDFTMLADEITDSEELYWPLSAISAWVQAKRPGPFELLPAIGSTQTPNARGIYHGTAAQEDDFVIHTDHRGRIRVDLVFAGGAHTTIGPTRGYDDEEQAKKAARDEAHKRGIRAGVLFRASRDGDLSQIGQTDKRHETNARGEGWDPFIAKQVGQIVKTVGAKKAISAARQDGRERVDPHVAEQVRKIVKLTGVAKFERMVERAQ